MDLSASVAYLRHLIDVNGIIQFSQGQRKDHRFGYAIEDQARALILSLKLKDWSLVAHFLSWIKIAHRPGLGMAMLWNPAGEFGPKVDHYQEASAETLWALGELANTSLPVDTSQVVRDLTYGLRQSPHPRVLAYAALGLTKQQASSDVKFCADRIVAFYRCHAQTDWAWFESRLTYANALLPWSLLVASQLFPQEKYLDIGLESLDFLLTHLKRGNIPLVVGNMGWWTKGRKMALFDQQPIDISYLVQACLEAYRLTGKQIYKQKAAWYFSWFKGNNLAKIPLIRPDGGCADSLTPRGPSPNSGAESIICFLLAALTLPYNVSTRLIQGVGADGNQTTPSSTKRPIQRRRLANWRRWPHRLTSPRSQTSRRSGRTRHRPVSAGGA